MNSMTYDELHRKQCKVQRRHHDSHKIRLVGAAHLTHIPTNAMLGFVPSSPIVRDANFQLVSEFAQPDAKRRLSLGEALAGATAYNIYRNSFGQLILDPVKAVPASEMWLYENPPALASVKRGLRESAEGKTVYRGSFAKHAEE